MEKLCLFEENFDRYVLDENIIGQGFESKVYSFGKNVLKIFAAPFQSRSNEKRIEALSKFTELDQFITLPTASVYLDYHFIGYRMKNAGIDLKSYLLDNTLDDNTIINILKVVKRCLLEIHAHGFVHGDLQPKNILIDNGNIKISDVNNAKFGKYQQNLLNDMTMHLVNYYGYKPVLDIQSLNYFTYILLNLDNEISRKYIQLGAEGYSFFREQKFENKFFDDEVCEEQMQYLLNPRLYKKKALTNSKFLIDYLK